MKEKINKEMDEQQIKQALIKKALGYDATEVVEEYAQTQEGEVTLNKRKVTKKNVPPDISAIKMLLEQEQTPIFEMSDQQLEQEKMRLLQLLTSQTKQKENEIANAKTKRKAV